MKKVIAFAAVLALMLTMVGGAYAADVKANITGSVVVKEKAVSIRVTTAKGEDGKPIAALAGKVLAVTGAKAADVEKLAGKHVEASGTVKDDKEIDVTTVAEKTAPAPKPAAPAPAPAK